MADLDWKEAHANAASASIAHPLVEDAIEEFMGNVGMADFGLPAYGIRKVALHAAQVARAHALGFDPELLRMTAAESDGVRVELAAAATRAGVPVHTFPSRPTACVCGHHRLDHTKQHFLWTGAEVCLVRGYGFLGLRRCRCAGFDVAEADRG